MGYLATTLKIGACLVISVVIIKLASDRQEVLKLLRHQEEPCVDCPDVLVGPAPRMDWPAWLPFANKMAEEIRLADESEVRGRLCLYLLLFGSLSLERKFSRFWLDWKRAVIPRCRRPTKNAFTERG